MKELEERVNNQVTQQDYTMRQQTEKEWNDKESRKRAFIEGSDIILKKMIANGRSSKEISRYKQSTEHGLKLF